MLQIPVIVSFIHSFIQIFTAVIRATEIKARGSARAGVAPTAERHAMSREFAALIPRQGSMPSRRHAGGRQMM